MHRNVWCLAWCLDFVSNSPPLCMDTISAASVDFESSFSSSKYHIILSAYSLSVKFYKWPRSVFTSSIMQKLLVIVRNWGLLPGFFYGSTAAKTAAWAL